MARAFSWQGAAGHHLPGVPARHLDEGELDELAAGLGLSRDEFLAYVGASPDFKPTARVADAVPAPRPEKPKVPLGTRPSGG